MCKEDKDKKIEEEIDEVEIFNADSLIKEGSISFVEGNVCEDFIKNEDIVIISE